MFSLVPDMKYQNFVDIYKDGAQMVVVKNHRSYEIPIYGYSPLQASRHHWTANRQNMDISKMKRIEDIPWVLHILLAFTC